jgi:AraC family transcriptional regulator, transcriptional activator FtrA
MPETRRRPARTRTTDRRHRVVALVYDRLGLFELAIVVEVFALPRPELEVPWYDFGICSVDPGPVRATGPVRIAASRSLHSIERADTVVVPGWRDPAEVPPARLLAAVRRAHGRGARVVSICSGVFVLAAAGLLDGKRATTHWRYTDELRRRYPRIRVEPDVLYVDEGSVLTSAGSAAGIDLCMHLVRLDHGSEIANQVARRLVVSPHRDGGQAQFIARPMPRRPERGLARAIDWALAHLDRPLTVGDLARQSAMSPRTLMRRFRTEMGATPLHWLNHQRVFAAQRRLESSSDSIEDVASAVGFGTAQTLRLHFRRVARTSPTAYRRRFSTRRANRSR